MKYVDPDGRQPCPKEVTEIVEEVPKVIPSLAYLSILKTIGTIGAIGIILVFCMMLQGDSINSNQSHQPSLVELQQEDENENRGNYHIMIQFQGPSKKGLSRKSGEGCAEVNIRREKPISGIFAMYKLKTLYKSLDKEEQKAFKSQYKKAKDFLWSATCKGGVGPGYKSFPNPNGNGDRCDMKFDGAINLVPWEDVL